jgi:RHH-type transcriptional regulator, rel operon repressor / antitoxin RelB
MLAIQLPGDIEARLEKLAKQAGRTKGFLVRRAILLHLDDLEDVLIAEKRLSSLRASRARGVTLNQLLKTHEAER